MTPGLRHSGESGAFVMCMAPVPHARLPSHPSVFPHPHPPTWSEFQHVSSFVSNMYFFPNCFTSRLSTELTLQGHVPPSRGHDGDGVSDRTRVPHRARGQHVAPKRDSPGDGGRSTPLPTIPSGVRTHRVAVSAQIRGSTGIAACSCAACGEMGSARGKNGDTLAALGTPEQHWGHPEQQRRPPDSTGHP